MKAAASNDFPAMPKPMQSVSHLLVRISRPDFFGAMSLLNYVSLSRLVAHLSIRD